ncbi:ABC transporter permease [Lactobacillus acetotolerans]|uniref:Transport permease protein n=2 Tax=Lactobacillus acetotolerans TaxID=1600 RepID=A0A5P5ZI64_9LACO|nr:ABC transporter permease [Lactobacillus acetotolerans]KRN39412.1 ABC-2 domain containing protein [Lactobacillus acetotolerans DSM 20749 = JCM 3825]QFG51186.1 ABC transporter permease subunit [Lactobacillus acetotolerans]GGV17105.1 transport permease protein [Lactobacillus acetotolerans DSM 20749 = JCM 3825]
MKTIKQLSVLTSRVIKQNLTDTDTIITTFIMPIAMLLFFVYIIGGNIAINGKTGSSGSYLAYSLPGFILMAMAMGSAFAALRINNDKNKGFMTRLLSLPIKRWAILTSYILASVIFMLISAVVIFLLTMLLGYRPTTTGANFGLFILVIVLFALMITLISLPVSLTAKNYNSSNSISYLLIFMLFLSSAFVPIAGMADQIRGFATYQPMTPITETIKALLNGSFSFNNLNTTLAIVWIVGLIIIFGILSLRRYKQIFVNN